MARYWLLKAALLCAVVCVSVSVPADAREERGTLGDVFDYIRMASPKAELAARTAQLNDDVRRAERRGDLSRSEAGSLYRRLDRVRDFLRDDRDLSRDEFKRRDGELDKIERDLERASDRRGRGRGRDRRERDRDYR